MKWVGRSARLRVFLTIACAACVAQLAAAQATQPSYSVRFYRPAAVGQSWRLDLTIVRDYTWRYQDDRGQTRYNGERLYGCKIVGRVTALATGGTDATGTYATRIGVDIESLTSYDGTNDHQLLPAGSSVTAELRGRQTVFTVAGKRPTLPVLTALRMLLHLDPDPLHARYHDQAFGIDRPVQPGDRWAVDPAVVSARMQRLGAPISPADVHGNVSFDDVQTIDGRPWLTLHLSLHSDPFKIAARDQSAAPAPRPPTTRQSASAPSPETINSPTQESFTTDSTYKIAQDPNLEVTQYDSTNETQFTGQMHWQGRLYDLVQIDRTATSETVTP